MSFTNITNNIPIILHDIPIISTPYNPHPSNSIQMSCPGLFPLPPIGYVYLDWGIRIETGINICRQYIYVGMLPSFVPKWDIQKYFSKLSKTNKYLNCMRPIKDQCTEPFIPSWHLLFFSDDPAFLSYSEVADMTFKFYTCGRPISTPCP